jgi:hypothetical protein
VSQPSGPLLVAAGIVALLGSAALVASHDATSTRPLPPSPPAALEISDSERAARLSSTGITIAAGWRPTDLIEDRTVIGPSTEDPWALADGPDGVGAWAPLLPRLRLLYDADGRLLVEDAVVVPDPAHCYRLARTVRRVGVGLPPPVGPAIADQLESWLEPPYFSGVRSPVGQGPCSGADRSQQGFAIEQAEPLDCSVPERDVICYTLAKWRYDFGPRDLWTSTHRVFDVTTGERLDDAELHPGLDVAAFEELLDEAVCAFGGHCSGIAMREGRIHPTRTALVIEFSPGEAADIVHGSLRVRIPRSTLPLLR